MLKNKKKKSYFLCGLYFFVKINLSCFERQPMERLDVF